MKRNQWKLNNFEFLREGGRKEGEIKEEEEKESRTALEAIDGNIRGQKLDQENSTRWEGKEKWEARKVSSIAKQERKSSEG